jgi:hypothetical protein
MQDQTDSPVGFDEMAKRWVCGDGFFLERDGNGDEMVGSLIEERRVRAGENGEQRKWKHRERKKKGRGRKKNLKKGLICPFFYLMKSVQ